MFIERITTVPIIAAQRHPAILATVTLHVEILLHRHDVHRLARLRCRHDEILADGAPRGEVELVAIVAVNRTRRVQRERNPVEIFVTTNAREAVRVEGATDCFEDALRDLCATLGAVFQTVFVARLTVGVATDAEELRAHELFGARHTSETGNVVFLPHRSATIRLACDRAATFRTHPEERRVVGVV